MPETHDVRSYLLGRLADTEASEIDMQIISDEGFAEEVSRAESDLIEAYIENELSDEETGSFLNYFLRTISRQEQLAETALIKRYALGHDRARDAAVTSETNSPTFLERLTGWYRPLAGATAVAAVVLIMFAVWVFYDGGQSPLESEYAALNARDLREPSATMGLSAIELNSATYRNNTANVRVDVSRFSDMMLFRLGLPFKPGEESTFSATLASPQKGAFTIREVKAYPLNAGGEIRVLFPKSAIAKGENEIKVVNLEDPQIKVDYSFTAE
jgi:hypothetical protein